MNFPEYFDEYQCRKAGVTESIAQRAWHDVIHDAPENLRIGSTGFDDDGDPVIFLGPGCIQDRFGIIMLCLYKGEWIPYYLNRDTSFRMQRWSMFRFD